MIKKGRASQRHPTLALNLSVKHARFFLQGEKGFSDAMISRTFLYEFFRIISLNVGSPIKHMSDISNFYLYGLCR
jgi:hypothetical protein